MFKSVGLDFDNLENDVGGFMPVSSTPQPIKSSPLPEGYSLDISDFVPNVGGSRMLTSDIPVNTEMPQVKQSKLDKLFDKWGWEPEEREVFAAQAQADPKGAAKFLQHEMIARRKAALTGKKEARDVLAKEKAIAEAMGIPVGEYMKQKFNKSGVNVTVQNMLGEPKPVTLPDGSQAFMRFPKGGGDPVIVQGAFPAAGDSEQMAAGYGERMAESEKIIRQVGEKGNPTVATSIAGSVLPGSAGRYVQSKVMTPEQQMHRQAQEDWVRAKLRKESGAVIAEEEMEREIATYFPKPGDTQQVIQQKAKARETAIQGMKKAAGPAGQRINAPTGKVRKYNPATGRIE
jgi:hypothetical protein